jgi:acetyl esterase
MSSSQITDPDVLAFIEKTLSLYPADTASRSFAEQRKLYDRMCDVFRQRVPANVATESGGINGPGGIIRFRRYWTSETRPRRLLYFHGGGFVLGGLESHDDICAELAQRCGIEVISIDYRLCPEHPHPAAFEDCEAAVDFFSDGEVLVAGDSAGGNLAAAVALTRRTEIAGQILIYPGLGGEAMNLPSYSERADAPLLSTQDVQIYGQLRTGGRQISDDPRLTPLSATEFKGAPPCFISAAEHDPLRDDGMAYVMRLADAGVRAEVNVEPELPHGHLRARTMAPRAAEAFDRVVEAIGEIVG